METPHPDPLDRRQVMAVADAEAEAIGSGSLERYLAILTDDAVFMPPNLLPKSGEELRQWLRDFLDQFTVEYLRFAHGDTLVSGDLACHEYSCSWRTTPKSGGPSNEAHFKGVEILRRTPGGSWRIARGIWNTNPGAVTVP